MKVRMLKLDSIRIFVTDALKVVDSDEISLELTAPTGLGCSRAAQTFYT